MTDPTTPASSDVTVEEMMQSLTGFDEIAIETHFGGFDVYSDGENKGVRAMRALAFVWHTRQGLNAREALKAAQTMSFKNVMEFFAEATEDLDPTRPDSASGKDSTPPA